MRILFLLAILLRPAFSEEVSLDLRGELREYFFYVCVEKGLSEIEIGSIDHSRQYIVDELSGYGEAVNEPMRRIREYATRSAMEAKKSDLSGKKGVLVQCLKAYESRDVELYIAGLVSDIKSLN